MSPSDIGKAYDQITHIWQDKGFDQTNGIQQHKKALTFFNANKTKTRHEKTKALDIGCGCTGRFIDLLQSESIEITGLDVSSEMLAIAKQRNPDVAFFHADICDYQLSDKYDFITAWDSIWHIPLQQQRSVITKIVDSLNKGGVFIFSFGGVEDEDEHRDDTMGPTVYYSTLGMNGFLTLFMNLGCKIKHVEFDQPPELHAYIIVEKV
ncbi:hypothetical protein MACH09_11130 [Vibrio sp. MACH09]|uniref:class I SAM-dependent DNA methyltransferase n=1 Tax=Vibrio sp. MACH09 TaxID=3025122 RepID=UPI00278FCE9E|nr:class I SAM-dependent methyltransferase [Vibrio sp. MACH09]GLO60605.1 hypothetical protein MACH09_11130 [Vibrio sp. MACH09]